MRSGSERKVRLSGWRRQARRRRNRKLLLPAICRNKTGVEWNHFLSSSPGSTNLFMYFFIARLQLTLPILWTYLPPAWNLCNCITSVMFSHLNLLQRFISIGEENAAIWLPLRIHSDQSTGQVCLCLQVFQIFAVKALKRSIKLSLKLNDQNLMMINME